MADADVALVVGAGDGLGTALAQTFADAGMTVVICARNAERIGALAERMRAGGGRVVPLPLDAGDEAAVVDAIARIEREHGPLAAAIFNVGKFARGSALSLSAAEFEALWRTVALGGFLVGREAARVMLPRGRGSILYTGATASLRGGAAFCGFASAKAALRSVAQSLAREFGPQGLHVAHVVVDGVIDSEVTRRDRPLPPEKLAGQDKLLQPASIAAEFLRLHQQPRNCWSFEIDLRPFAESF